jgi:hypothetical protein
MLVLQRAFRLEFLASQQNQLRTTKRNHAETHVGEAMGLSLFQLFLKADSLPMKSQINLFIGAIQLIFYN